MNFECVEVTVFDASLEEELLCKNDKIQSIKIILCLFLKRKLFSGPTNSGADDAIENNESSMLSLDVDYSNLCRLVDFDLCTLFHWRFC